MARSYTLSDNKDLEDELLVSTGLVTIEKGKNWKINIFYE